MVGHSLRFDYRMTPAAHWIGIINILIKDQKIEKNNAAYLLASSSVVMADAFIVCWKLKYDYNLIRPISVIQKHIDSEWQSTIDNPAFPEYVSGHSMVSMAVAQFLKNELGKITFEDTTQKKYTSFTKEYDDFIEAAQEAGWSRFYGAL